LEKEIVGDKLVVHNYGAAGAGYQASWWVPLWHEWIDVCADTSSGEWQRKLWTCWRRTQNCDPTPK